MTVSVQFDEQSRINRRVAADLREMASDTYDKHLETALLEKAQELDDEGLF